MFAEWNIDIALLQEVDLTDLDHNRPFTMPGYTTFTHPGQKKRTLTLVKQGSVSHAEEVQLELQGRPETWLKIAQHDDTNFLMGNIYREWVPDARERAEHFGNMLSNLQERYKNILMAGDFNLDFDRKNDPNYLHAGMARDMLHCIHESGLTTTGFGQTFLRPRLDGEVSSSLDWVASSLGIKVEEPRQGKSHLSDHSPLLWRIPAQMQRSTNTMKVRNLKKINRAAFLNHLAAHNREKMPQMDVEEQAEFLHGCLLNSLETFAPLREIKVKRKRTPQPSQALMELRRKRDNARGKNRLKFKVLRNRCVALGKTEVRENNTRRLEKDSGQVWKILKETTGKAEKETIKLKEGSHTLTLKESAVAFNTFFLEKVEKIKSKIQSGGLDPLENTRRRAEKLGIKKNSFALRTVTEKKVLEAIRKSKNSSCPDIDGLSPEVLKLAAPVISVPLTWVINSTIESQSIPNVWKRAKILPLHKKKAKSSATNYRPVSILPSCSKIMEEVVRQQLAQYCRTQNIIPTSQHGFQTGKSTITALGAVTHDLKAMKQEGLEVGCLLFDLSAAFDLLDADILARKLEIYGATETTTAWVRNYLTGRSQMVEYGGHHSKIEDVMVGSPQGSVLSPLLFIIQTSDMPEAIKRASSSTYADDTLIYTGQQKQEMVYEVLEAAVDEVLLYMRANKLAANPEKTKFMMIGKKKAEKIRVGTEFIEESYAEDYLGVKISKNLTWTKQFEALKSELSKRIGIIRRLSHHLPKAAMKKVINPMFTSKVQYALAIQLVKYVRTKKKIP